jgi:hypothetical protein
MAEQRGFAVYHLPSAIEVHLFVESEGAHHWRVWRRYLRDLSPLLFK